MTLRSSASGVLKRVARRVLLITLLLLALFLFHLYRFGCPDWLTQYALDMASRGNFLILAQKVRVSPFEGLVLEQARLFRKGVVGAAAVEADRAVVEIDLIAAAAGRSAVRKLTVRGAVLRPGQAYAREAAGTQAYFDGQIPQALELYDVLVDGIRVDQCRMMLRGEETELDFRDITADVSSENLRGMVQGSLSFDSRSALLTGEIVIAGNPRLFECLMNAHGLTTGVEIARCFRFDGAAPRASCKFSRVCRPGGAMNLEGSAWLQDFSYQGVDVLRLDSGIRMRFSATNSLFRLERMMLVRPEGLARGSLVFESTPAEWTVAFELDSSIEPKAVSLMTGVLTNLFCNELAFDAPYKIAARGKVNLDDRHLTRIESSWKVGGCRVRNLSMEDCSFAVNVAGFTNRIEEVSAILCRGALKGSLTLLDTPEDSEPLMFMSKGSLYDADFEKFMHCFVTDDTREYRGRLSGEWDIQGRSGIDPTRYLSGTGSLRVNDGMVFMMPIFGGLSSYLSRAIPGLEFVMRQSDAKTKFALGGGKVHSDRILIEGGVLSLTGSGDYYFDDRLDFTAQVSLFKSHTFIGKFVRIPTYLISKLFEFRLLGTLDDPEWRAVNFSEDLLNKLGITDGKDSGEQVEPAAGAAEIDD